MGKGKLAHPRGETSNFLLDTLGEWNNILERSTLIQWKQRDA